MTPETSVLVDVIRVYEGSDGDLTRALYARLELLGPAGQIAVNLFRACKTSARAKVYRGGERGRGSYRSMAYNTKQWAMENLTKILADHGEANKLRWGWKEDPDAEFHRWVLYVDLPTGQVSFHAGARGAGPDYPADWDGLLNVSASRICRWVAQLLTAEATA